MRKRIENEVDPPLGLDHLQTKARVEILQYPKSKKKILSKISETVDYGRIAHVKGVISECMF